ncbi:MAG: GtrA family protein [Gammaproteobacteria bacterium]|nr:GtrA family protein [Gammaproteobacteria bacterium]
MNPAYAMFARFAVTGVVTALTYLVLSLAFEQIVGTPAVASLIAYALVIIVHFSLNNFYTFQKRRLELAVIVRYALFIIAFAILNYVVNALVQAFELPSIVLYLVNMVVSPLISYGIMKSFVFVR